MSLRVGRLIKSFNQAIIYQLELEYSRTLMTRRAELSKQTYDRCHHSQPTIWILNGFLPASTCSSQFESTS
jgi:hypothetical protein